MKLNRESIEKRIANLEKQMENAENYLKTGENIEGLDWLHLDDWAGHSGHPKWVKNHMIPSIKKRIAEQEKLIKKIESNNKEKKITVRRK